MKKHDIKIFHEDFFRMLNHGHTVEVSKRYDGITILSVKDITHNEQVYRMLHFGFEYNGHVWSKKYEEKR